LRRLSNHQKRAAGGYSAQSGVKLYLSARRQR
jgi:hypothetical protein